MGSDGEPIHLPVLLCEVLDLLSPRDGGVYVDATVGLGGHSTAILEACDSRVVGIDRDPESLELARRSLSFAGGRAMLIRGDYREGPKILEQVGVDSYDGVLFDLGLSSLHLDQGPRGFSIRHPGPLDMRFDRQGGEPSLANRLGHVSVEELADIIYRYGEERASRRIARGIKEAFDRGRLKTTADLATLVARLVGRSSRRVHPATRTFQALRIWVNDELAGLDRAIREWALGLPLGGVVAVISFHSLEDRSAKITLRSLRDEGWLLLTKKPLRSSTADNPRSRSARLRAARRVESAPAGPVMTPAGPVTRGPGRWQ